MVRAKNINKTVAELFIENGVPIVRSDNNRVQGHLVMKDMMNPIPLKDPYVKSLFAEGKAPDTLPGLMFFDNVDKVVSDICAIQADERNPNDWAKMPHDVTHTVDLVRYYAISRVAVAEVEKPPIFVDEDLDEQDYETFMCGGDMADGYMDF